MDTRQRSNQRGAHAAPPEASRTRRVVALLVATLVGASLMVVVSPPSTASAGLFDWLRPTTTKAPTTTTTKAPTTTTTAAPTTTTTEPVGEPTTPAPDAGDCGGATPRKANGTAWTCTFSDEFTGTELNRDIWHVQTSKQSGFGSQTDCIMDDPANVRVGEQVLNLTVRKLAQPMLCQLPKAADNYTTSYTGASVSTYQRWKQAFGRFEIRARFPSSAVPGIQGALWLWPDDIAVYGSRSGEIDIAEVFSQYNDRAIPYIHYGSTKNVTNNYCLVSVDKWHTYAVEWTTTNITISYDGKVCLNHKIGAFLMAAPKPFDQPFMIALTEFLGVGGNKLDPAKQPPLPATLMVDYVRVWK